MNNRFFYIMPLTLLLLLYSCSKKSELNTLPDNPFDPAVVSKYFTVDTLRSDPAPYVKLDFHIQYNLIPSSFSLAGVLICRDGTSIHYVDCSHGNPGMISFTDTTVSRFHNYSYSFALERVGFFGSNRTPLSIPYNTYVN